MPIRGEPHIPTPGMRDKRFAEPIDGYPARDPLSNGPVESHRPQVQNVPDKPRPRRRSRQQKPPRSTVQPERQAESGLDVFPALMDEEVPPEELMMLLARLLYGGA